MKKTILSIFSFALAMVVSVSANASSLDSVVSGKLDGTKEREVKQAPENVDKKVSNSSLNDPIYDYIAVTSQNGTTKTVIAGTVGQNGYEYKKSFKDNYGYTNTSYYKIINNKLVNYKAEYYYIDNGVKYSSIANFDYDTTLPSNLCSTVELEFGCVKKVGTEQIIKNELFKTEKAVTSTRYQLSYYNYVTYYGSTNTKLFEDSRGYHTNGKLSYQYKTTKNTSNALVKEEYYSYTDKGSLRTKRLTNSAGKNTYYEYRGYYSNGKMAYQDITYRTSTGALSKVLSYDYDSRGRLVKKNFRNSKNYTYFREARSYFSNNKLYQRTYAYLSGTSSYNVKSAYYFKYRSNGTKSVYKRMYFNTKGYLTRMYSYVYNTRSQLKSNKYGSAYKYTTYFKTNTNLIYKTTKAKYSSGGRLGKAVTIRPTTFTRTYYKGY